MFEQLLKVENINLAIGIALVVIAVIALIWMCLWFKKSKEYKNLLKSIDEKVNAYSNDGGEIKEKKENSDNQNINEKDDALSESAEEHNFSRATDAIEILEKAESKEIEEEEIGKEKLKEEDDWKKHKDISANVTKEDSDDVEDRQENVEEVETETENIKERSSKVVDTVENTEDVLDDEEKPPIQVKTVEIPKFNEELDHNCDDSFKKDLCTEETVEKEPEIVEQDDDEDDECAVDVFDEIRKMLVETEQNLDEKLEEKEEMENVAKSGKEYTREELEDLIKF